MSTFGFTVNIEPIGKARPRMTRSGHVYTPKETVDAERAIATAYKRYKGGKAEKGVPVSIDVYAYFRIASSWSEKRKTAAMDGQIKPTKKPDADNILKLVADALNGVAYEDDAQVVDVSLQKQYVHRDGPGYLQIIVCTYDGKDGRAYE